MLASWTIKELDVTPIDDTHWGLLEMQTRIAASLLAGPLVGTFVKQANFEGAVPSLDVSKLVDQSEQICREIYRRNVEIVAHVQTTEKES